MVVFGIFPISNPDEGSFQQADDGGNDAFPRKTGAIQVARYLPADTG